ncbi:protein disulfide-isomerase domain [Polytolypa hystricis UAMH7299]|uniref:Protein disulfide-isomerase domain n=1 Tax=Polytolypa hystricis (strain UAMH7299) TaxID=1447883 RepID=A0A2B7YSN2_POLH7|nr:protein disulfide-isomerase domain [Polytolypa hystricis UAMH7299]
MKPSILTWSLLSLLLRPTFAAPENAPAPDDVAQNAPPVAAKDDAAGGEVAPADDGSTVFNGITVPVMKEIEGPKFEETVKEGYWFVKHYSPSCIHCKRLAPTWQTLYEFYYTSNPLSSSTSKQQPPDGESSMNSFHGFYNFHFASLNCLSYGDKCQELDVKLWPTFTLYHESKPIETFTDPKSMENLSKFVEKHLEIIRPGSRTPEGPTLPAPGDSKVDTETTPNKGDTKKEKEASKPETGETPTESQVAKTSPTAKPRPIPNPQGTSVPLTAESFQKLVTATRDPWFIKFYAPWCTHCQSLAPTWRQMAKEMKGSLNVGEVNCETERRLCKDAHVNSYPTMHFFRGGERVEYEGHRGLGDLINYAKKAVDVVGNGVQYVDAAAFKEMEETEEVIFVYFFDHATTSEDFLALDRLTLSLVGKAKLVKTNDTILYDRYKIHTFPRLIVSRDGRPNYYTPLAPKDIRDFRQVLTWIQRVWLPIVPELTAANAREIMDGKYVVLGVLNRARTDEFIQDKRELKNAALEWMEKQTKLFQLERQEMRDEKQLRIEEAEDRNDQRALRAAKGARVTITEHDKKQVVFAWVDGIFWDRWIRTTYGMDVKNGERVIINDEENRRYWDTTVSGNHIMPSRTSILETLTRIVQNNGNGLKSKSTVGFFEGLFFSMKSFTFSHPIIAAIIFLAVSAFATLCVKGKIRRGKNAGGILGAVTGSSGNGFFHLDGKEGLLGSGGSGGGKVD